jgi:hypothetical protein
MDNQPRRVTTIAATIALLAIALALFGQGTATAQEPELLLSPSDGPPGSTTTACGRNFPAGATGWLIWEDNGIILTDFTADDEGAFAATVTIPTTPAGDYTVIARAGAINAPAQFAVQGEGAAPTDASPVATPAASPSPVTPSASPVAAECV